MVVNKYSWRCWVNFHIIFTIFSSPVLGCSWHEETLVAPVLPAGLAEGPGLGEAGQHHEEEDHGEGGHTLITSDQMLSLSDLARVEQTTW